MNEVKFDEEIGHQASFKVGGYFTFRCVNPDGSIAWEEKCVLNGVPDAAINSLLDVYLRGQTQLGTWYLGLIDNTSFSALAAGDTMGSHAGWIENTQYAAATRPQWSPSAAASKQITNPTPVGFAINASVVIKGAFMTSNNTKGGTSGTLFATATFSSTQTLSSGQTLNVTYTVTGAST